MIDKQIMFSGFSKLSKEEKLKIISKLTQNPDEFYAELKSFWHPNENLQKKFDEFSENTLTNFYMPFGVVPNVKINDKFYAVPMVIEESSVVAAAAKSAKFWLGRGGFKAEVIDTVKLGQVHFIWHGDYSTLKNNFSSLKKLLFENSTHITANMQKRGGGIIDIELVNHTEKEPGYYQLMCSFNTCDSMGANFINSCLEEFASILKDWFIEHPIFSEKEKEVEVIMSILSNYTPDCLVKCWVECPIDDLGSFENGVSAQEFAQKFAKAIRIAEIDPYRATTHNKGIYNGIDSVVLATGNDFRAVEACGHAYAGHTGTYKSLSELSLDNGIFKFTLTVPMALGVVGGLTGLHPVVKRGLEMLGHPSAKELMMIAATIGLANNFSAVKSLTTVGIQQGHMKMHLFNIMNHFEATEVEKEKALDHFITEKVSFSTVREFIEKTRSKQPTS
jgi:hydroxymethylglutaryl-CoA reductase